MMCSNETKNLIRQNKGVLVCLIIMCIVFVLYLLCNVIFWFCGTPACFFEYDLTEKDTVRLKYCSSPFFLVNIPETIDGKTVTEIDSHLFRLNLESSKSGFSYKTNPIKNLITAVHLPDTVESIGFSAFYNCSSLRYINMPSALRCTSEHLLSGTRVKKLVFPENITEIGYNPDEPDFHFDSFDDMKYLKEVVFPDTLKRIGNNTFADCPKLKKVVLPDGIEEIDFAAFSGSGLTEINLPDSLVNLRGCAFRGTPFEEKLKEQAVNGFVILNGRFLYAYVGAEEHVEIPNGIVYLCDRAFSYSYIKTVSIPASVKYINNAFEFSSIEELVIPDTVDPDNQMRFYNSSNLKRVFLPDHLTTITSSAFSSCYALESIHIPAHTTEIGSGAFSGCRALKEITLPDGVTTIGSDAFADSGLETINIPDSVTVIGERAFQNTPFDRTDVLLTQDGRFILNQKVYALEAEE